MNTRGMRRVIAAAALVVTSAGLVACGNQAPAGGGAPSTGVSTPAPSTTPPPSAPIKPSTNAPTATPSATPTGGPTATPSKPVPTPSTSPTKPPAVQRLANAMLLTGKEVASADPKRGWAATSAPSRSICGKAATQGNGVQGRLTRSYANGMDASGGQWLTRYQSPAAAKAAYEQIVATIKSCKAGAPGKTHARKLTENRTLAVGDATAILRWYDYPLPSDQGSEDGGFPYAVTRKGTVVSVIAFGEMGKGIAPAHWEALTQTAAAKLP
ncbi:hypothetical protein E1263_03765 [Kribbella antibiotica]|uniref:PknH-like extracellular domain-containing protein n=1 Tax=Kribbella antibiotica TaxID=190195 RepID=A0A4R4ZWC5_9ACTN|nr:hypothetical protein [Kribbella antibiotica]TDD62564.1 hypothetical protein E1263_03765 [Kribbella antibiotica]